MGLLARNCPHCYTNNISFFLYQVKDERLFLVVVPVNAGMSEKHTLNIKNGF